MVKQHGSPRVQRGVQGIRPRTMTRMVGANKHNNQHMHMVCRLWALSGARRVHCPVSQFSQLHGDQSAVALPAHSCDDAATATDCDDAATGPGPPLQAPLSLCSADTTGQARPTPVCGLPYSTCIVLVCMLTCAVKSVMCPPTADAAALPRCGKSPVAAAAKQRVNPPSIVQITHLSGL